MIVGDIKSILDRSIPELIDPTIWSERDSDVIGHAIQVHSQLIRSRWARADISFTTNNLDRHESSFPSFEDFVFAAVYLRQFIARDDRLLEDAVGRYCNHAACGICQTWMKYELDSFHRILARKTFPISIGDYSAREIIDAFFYGAAIFHDVPDPRCSKRRCFIDIQQHHRREHVLFALNGAMAQLLQHVNNIVLPMQKHFADWQSRYSIPAPNIYWHTSLFETEQQKGADEFKLGVATYKWSMRK
jgi:hypothetical protein